VFFDGGYAGAAPFPIFTLGCIVFGGKTTRSRAGQRWGRELRTPVRFSDRPILANCWRKPQKETTFSSFSAEVE
jgi:hypothetical protein